MDLVSWQRSHIPCVETHAQEQTGVTLLTSNKHLGVAIGLGAILDTPLRNTY